MINRSRTIADVKGFRITVDPFLPVITIFLTWLLADNYYPRYLIGYDGWLYWLLGVISALLLTVSILVHEFGHAWMARRLGLPTDRVHLFLFGGMAELKQRPMRPAQEMWIALAGPAASGMLFLLSMIAGWALKPISPPISEVAFFLTLMNGLLLVFNVVPIFPLDGGRALRGWLWSRKNRFYEASAAAFRISTDLIAVLFLLSFVSWFWIDAKWTFWIAIFAFYMMYTALNARRELTSIPIADDLIFRLSGDVPFFTMVEEVAQVDPDFLRDAILPVFENGVFSGVIFGSRFSALPEYAPLLPQRGTYIDISEHSTYEQGIEFQADFVPVLQNGRLLGLCDPKEFRFWLKETAMAENPAQSMYNF